MKDHHYRRRRSEVVSWSRLFWCTLSVVCVFFTLFSFRFFSFSSPEKFQPELVTWRTEAIEAIISNDSPSDTGFISVRETVILPDQFLLFLKCPRAPHLFTKDDLDCVYFPPHINNTGSTLVEPQLIKQPLRIEGRNFEDQMVRCPLGPRGFSVSVALRQTNHGNVAVGPSYKWDLLVYEAMIDTDNTTLAFVKGLNLRPDRVYNASKFECVYGWDFQQPKLLLRSHVVSIAQEIVRCKTPLSILSSPLGANNTIKVSIRVKGRGTLPSVARPMYSSKFEPNLKLEDVDGSKPHQICVCTMLRNQARFIKEWVMYHSKIGVERWFIYDNNSDDDIDSVLASLVDANFNISRHIWPWIKTQEAGFAHCALRARGLCEWVGFIDVDEFFHLPSGLTLQEAITNQSTTSNSSTAEIRVACLSFGPSGLKHVPQQGVMMGYTCRKGISERHKSIVRPEALNSTLINVVHHFRLKSGFRYVNGDRGVIVINHYKYQVWEVFKEKFYRRVATYVTDWKSEQNAGSKDRAPGLGTRAVEPLDWSSRFCEVTDTGLRDHVLQSFVDPLTKLMPWQEQ